MSSIYPIYADVQHNDAGKLKSSIEAASVLFAELSDNCWLITGSLALPNCDLTFLTLSRWLRNAFIGKVIADLLTKRRGTLDLRPIFPEPLSQYFLDYDTDGHSKISSLRSVSQSESGVPKCPK